MGGAVGSVSIDGASSSSAPATGGGDGSGGAVSAVLLSATSPISSSTLSFSFLWRSLEKASLVSVLQSILRHSAAAAALSRRISCSSTSAKKWEKAPCEPELPRFPECEISIAATCRLLHRRRARRRGHHRVTSRRRPRELSFQEPLRAPRPPLPPLLKASSLSDKSRSKAPLANSSFETALCSSNSFVTALSRPRSRPRVQSPENDRALSCRAQ